MFTLRCSTFLDPVISSRPSMKLLLTLLTAAMLTTTAALAADGPIRHVVHFKFKDTATAAEIDHVLKEFAALKGKIDVIESLEWGTDVSPEGLSKDFKHCWIVSFKDAAARDIYLKHKDHEAFVAIVKPLLADVLVVDFVPQK